MSLVPFCGWQAPAQGCREDPAKNGGDSLGLTGAHPGRDHSQTSVQSCTPSPDPGRLRAEICTENICTPGPAWRRAHSRLPAPHRGSHRHETESKAASRPRSPPWGTQGRRLAHCPQADPHRWPVFHSCRDKMDIENLNCLWAGEPFHSRPELKSP